MANTVTPVAFATERWMRMPSLGNPNQTLGDLFVFSGYADFTGGSEPIVGVGEDDTKAQVGMRIGPHWLRVHGICPVVVIGGHSQLAPDHADGMGFRVQNITDVQVVDDGLGVRRIELEVNVVVRGGVFGQILTLAYQVMAWGTLANPMGNEGIFFPGASPLTQARDVAWFFFGASIFFHHDFFAFDKAHYAAISHGVELDGIAPVSSTQSAERMRRLRANVIGANRLAYLRAV